MILYLFKDTQDKHLLVDEKIANNYLRHPTRYQKQEVKYLGGIDGTLIQKLYTKVKEELKEKYGAISFFDDVTVQESRQIEKDLIDTGMIEIYKTVNKNITPRNLDWMGENGAELKNKSIFNSIGN